MIFRVVGIPKEGLLFQRVKVEEVDALFHTKEFVAVDLYDTQRRQERGRSFPERRERGEVGDFRPRFMNTWTFVQGDADHEFLETDPFIGRWLPGFDQP